MGEEVGNVLDMCGGPFFLGALIYVLEDCFRFSMHVAPSRIYEIRNALPLSFARLYEDANVHPNSVVFKDAHGEIIGTIIHLMEPA